MLHGLIQRLAIVQSTAATRRDSLRLVTLLAEHGVQSATEVRQAQPQLLATENQVPALERSIAQNEDALSTLLVRYSRRLVRERRIAQRASPASHPTCSSADPISARPSGR